MCVLPLSGAGLAVGGVWGLYEGLWRPDGKTVRLRMNAVLNGITRRGPFTGNSLGVLGEWDVRVRGCEGEVLNWVSPTHCPCVTCISPMSHPFVTCVLRVSHLYVIHMSLVCHLCVTHMSLVCHLCVTHSHVFPCVMQL